MTTPTRAQIEAAAKVLACRDKHIDQVTQADINSNKAVADFSAAVRAFMQEQKRQATAITIERCAKVAEDVFRHTSSYTQERDVAHKLCPRIAAAIRAKAQDDG